MIDRLRKTLASSQATPFLYVSTAAPESYYIEFIKMNACTGLKLQTLSASFYEPADSASKLREYGFAGPDEREQQAVLDAKRAGQLARVQGLAEFMNRLVLLRMAAFNGSTVQNQMEEEIIWLNDASVLMLAQLDDPYSSPEQAFTTL